MDINTKLRLYEEALKKLGVNPADVDEHFAAGTFERRGPEDSREYFGTIPGVDSGMLFAEEGKSRYLENHLWTSISSEFRDNHKILQDSSDEEEAERDYRSTPEMPSEPSDLLFGTPRSSNDVHCLHPRPVQIFKLWQTYLDNVNPLVKIFHTPTTQQLILNATGNLENVPKNLEALMFGIYCCVLVSLSDAECDAIMGEGKSTVLRRFRSGCQQALINASFLKSSDMMVLQALVLLLLSLKDYDARSLWVLTGVATRIGQRSGLHRDGSALRLSVFEAEMRRRLWWQINLIDAYAEKLAGVGRMFVLGDVQIPLNVNDSELNPDMRDPPKEHDGPTEMMFFLIRCHVGDFLRRSGPNNAYDGTWSRLSQSGVPIADKDKAIDEFEDLLKRKFLNYCDESIPSHLMAAYLSRAVICTMRFIAHNPDQYEDKGASMPQKEKNLLFDNCVKVISYQNMAFIIKGTQGFAWHVNMHFQWKAFIYILNELRYRTSGEDAELGWQQVQMVYERHPDFIADSKRALPVAVGNLAIKAWEAFVASRGIPDGETPHFISVLRSQRAEGRRSAQVPVSASTLTVDVSPEIPSVEFQPALDPLEWNEDFSSSLDLGNDLDPSYITNLPPLEPDQMNWAQWESLLQSFELENVNPSAPNGHGFG